MRLEPGEELRTPPHMHCLQLHPALAPCLLEGLPAVRAELQEGADILGVPCAGAVLHNKLEHLPPVGASRGNRNKTISGIPLGFCYVYWLLAIMGACFLCGCATWMPGKLVHAAPN
jgi:hypothetical protein